MLPKVKENYALIRASTDEQKLSLEFQKDSIIKKAQEMEVVLKEENIFIDAGISGFTTNYKQRPGTAKLMEKVKNGQVDMIFMYRRDRLSRKAFEYLALVYTMHTNGVKPIFTDHTELPFTPGYGWIIEGTLAALLQREVENIRDKVTLGLKTLHKSGKWPGGRPPFGLSYNKDKKTFRVKEHEVKAVKELFARLADGEEPASICKYFREHNYPGPPQGWTPTLVHKIGGNPLYMGVVERYNQRIQLNKFNPVVDYKIWHQAQNTLDKYQPAKRKRNNLNKNILFEEGLVRCAVKSARFKVLRQGQYYVYNCEEKKECKIPCSNYRISENKLGKKVFEYCQSWFKHLDVTALSKYATKSLTNKKKKLVKEIKKLTLKKEKIFNEKIGKSDQLTLEQNVANKNEIAQKILSINKRQLEVTKQLDNFRLAVAEIDQRQQRQGQILKVVCDWDRLFSKMSYEEKKSFYKHMIRFVYMHPTKDIEILLNQRELLDLT